MEKEPAWAAPLGAFIVIAIFGALSITIAGAWQWVWDISGSTWAAWVQAIGSVGAIYASVKLVQRQHNHEKAREIRKALAERRNAFESVFQLIGAVHQIAENIEKWMLSDNPQIGSLEVGVLQLEGFAAAFARVDHLKYDSHLILEGLLATEGLNKILMNGISDLIESVRRSPGLNVWGQAALLAQSAREATKPRLDLLRAEIVKIDILLRAFA